MTGHVGRYLDMLYVIMLELLLPLLNNSFIVSIKTEKLGIRIISTVNVDQKPTI